MPQSPPLLFTRPPSAPYKELYGPERKPSIGQKILEFLSGTILGEDEYPYHSGAQDLGALTGMALPGVVMVGSKIARDFPKIVKTIRGLDEMAPVKKGFNVSVYKPGSLTDPLADNRVSRHTNRTRWMFFGEPYKETAPPTLNVSATLEHAPDDVRSYILSHEHGHLTDPETLDPIRSSELKEISAHARQARLGFGWDERQPPDIFPEFVKESTLRALDQVQDIDATKDWIEAKLGPILNEIARLMLIKPPVGPKQRLPKQLPLPFEPR